MGPFVVPKKRHEVSLQYNLCSLCYNSVCQGHAIMRNKIKNKKNNYRFCPVVYSVASFTSTAISAVSVAAASTSWAAVST